MKVLIQHPRTFEYLNTETSWSPALEEALDFQFALNAISYGVNRLKQPFLIFFKFDQESLDFTSYSFAREVPRPSRTTQSRIPALVSLVGQLAY